jgi:hypothetical protein
MPGTIVAKYFLIVGIITQDLKEVVAMTEDGTGATRTKDFAATSRWHNGEK